MEIVRFIIFKFLSSISHSHVLGLTTAIKVCAKNLSITGNSGKGTSLVFACCQP